MKLLSHSPESEPALKLDNTVDAQSVSFEGTRVIELNFPKFTDGRAYSQAHVLRRRGFAGDLRATGEVLVDQLVQLRRCGFTSVSASSRSNVRATCAPRLFGASA